MDAPRHAGAGFPHAAPRPHRPRTGDRRPRVPVACVPGGRGRQAAGESHGAPPQRGHREARRSAGGEVRGGPPSRSVALAAKRVRASRAQARTIPSVSRSGDPSGWILFGVIAIALWFGLVSDSDWLAKEHATSQYGLPDRKIQIVGKRPHDCDFMTAPLGEKHCSYKREYLADWFTLSTSNQPIAYGTIQE